MSLIQTQANERRPGFICVPVLAEPLRGAVEPVSVAMPGAWLDGSMRLVGGYEVGREQGAEGVSELSLCALILPNKEALEDRLVEAPSDLRRRVAVGFVAVREERQAVL